MAPKPMSGLRVIDLGHEWACPHAGRLLADFGAEVIKVEYTQRLDHMRGARKDDQMYNKHPRFLQINRNKRSVTLDLRNPEQREVFEQLVRESDVVLSNARPGVLDRLDLNYDALKKIRPDIILASLSACGQTGPDRTYAGYGGGLEASSGVQSLTAYTHDGVPKRIREIDVTNGIAGAAAILTALARRDATGEGGWIDLSELVFPIYAVVGEYLAEFAENEATRLPLGNRDAEHAPHGCYPCSGDDAWIVISISDEQQWEAFCRVSDNLSCLVDPRFNTQGQRHKHQDQLDEIIRSWTCKMPKHDAMLVLQQAGVPAGVVMDTADLARDPHLRSRGYFSPLSEDPQGPDYSGFPFRFAKQGGEVREKGPELGEGNRYLVRELLGLSEDRVVEFDESKLITDFDDI